MSNVNNEPFNKKQNLIQVKTVLVILFFLFFLILAGITIYQYFQINSLENDKKDLESKVLEVQQKEEFNIEKDIKNRRLNYFVEDILPKYPDLESEIRNHEITKVFSFISKDNSRSIWLIETKNQSSLNHYLINSKLVKKLDHSISSSSSDDARCNLVDVETIGDEQNLQRELQEPQGYLVLSSINCSAYGGGDFVSIYSLASGKKIKMVGNNFKISGSSWHGISDTGNALGRLRGIYGIDKPMVVVDYGSFESAANELEEVILTAYFDLQTGKLIDIRRYN
ncbi:MAG: hypothetical protein GF381_02975 [Candidatus Pacebacteria bacterium]|nr:hypothetical protein [Candidatus Paceibacterota bacterium]